MLNSVSALPEDRTDPNPITVVHRKHAEVPGVPRPEINPLTFTTDFHPSKPLADVSVISIVVLRETLP